MKGTLLTAYWKMDKLKVKWEKICSIKSQVGPA